MASAWVVRTDRGGTIRYRVLYRLGGRESTPRHAGSFRTKREALARRAYVAGELAALRVPELGSPVAEVRAETVAQLAADWQAARIDVAAGTAETYRVALGRILPRLGERAARELDAADVASLVAELAAAGLRKQTIRKTVSVLAMILDHHAITPNPARDRQRVKLPRESKREVQPPTAAHVLAVHRLLPSAYRLPLVVLEATGMRVSELETLTWGDLDEPRGRWRIAAAASKTGSPRWVSPGETVLAAVLALVPREDRVLESPVLPTFRAEPFRTALARACRAAGVPLFSPHDLRHRRVSLLHAQGVPWARIGELVGHADLVTTARTYTHVVADEQELDYSLLLGAGEGRSRLPRS